MPKKILIPAGAAIVMDELTKNGFEAYIVGGCVRDQLLGIEPHDYDICTSATPEEVIRCFPDHKIVRTGIKHGTVTVFVTPSLGFEVTTFRTDGVYSDNRRPDSVEFVADIEQDLARRDFTMNAMAYNEQRGLVDPFGGEEDLRLRLIHCVGNPDDRFQEDALRILRALRFSSVYGMEVSANTARSIRRNVGLLNNIAKERVNSELCRILTGKGVLNVLLGYSEVFSTIIPELKPCVGFDQNSRFHQYNVYDHIAHAVANYHGGDVVTAMALLMHDIGKPRCYTEDEKGGHFKGHAIPGYAIAQDVLADLRFDRQSQHDIAELVLYHDTVIEPTKRTVRKWLNKLGEKQLFRLMDVRIADIMAHADGTQEDRLEKYRGVLKLAQDIVASKQCFTLDKLAINGKDVILDGIPQGPMVGCALNTALNGVMADRVPNERKALLEYIQAYFAFVRNRIDVSFNEMEPFCPFWAEECVGYCNGAYTDKCYSCECPIQEWIGKENNK